VIARPREFEGGRCCRSVLVRRERHNVQRTVDVPGIMRCCTKLIVYDPEACANYDWRPAPMS